MEQNNYTPNREPLPTFDDATVAVRQPQAPAQQPAYQQPAYQQPTYQQPVYQQPVYQQPAYQQPMYQQPAVQRETPPEIAKKADSAFTKALIATIICELPIGSIIAIFLSIASRIPLREAQRLAELHGVSAGGKAVAAKILGIISLILSIVSTVIYALYSIYIVLYIFIFFAALGGF